MKLKFGNKEYELKSLTLNDWIDMEDQGLNMGTMNSGKLKLRDFRTLCFTLIKKIDPGVTIEWVGEQMSINDADIFEKVAEFVAEGTNKNLKGEKKN